MKDNDNMDYENEESLPSGKAKSWGLGKQSRRGPKRELSINQIVGAAINIADKGGLSALTMGSSRIVFRVQFFAIFLSNISIKRWYK